jgi:hypothetical protein
MFVGHVACIQEKINSYRILVINHKKRSLLDDPVIDDRIILVLNKS